MHIIFQQGAVLKPALWKNGHAHSGNGFDSPRNDLAL
jgi:hypothetical protein